MVENIIEINGLYYSYDDADNYSAVIENLNLNIKRGSFTVILGHNGSGKSTLAKLLNGLYRPTGGSVSVNGMLTSDEDKEFDIKKTVGMVFQNPDNQLVASVVEEDVAFGPENLSIPPDEIRKRVDNALKSVGMYDYRDASPSKLSGGQKQRVAIAGVIAMQPECIVLDEPTAMLDPSGRREVIDTVIKLNKEQGITVILITHFMEEAEKADRVIVMDDGKILDDGRPEEIFSKVEFLKKCGLDVPQTTELLNELSKNGLNVSSNIISVEDAAEEIAKLF
ncbi:MAG: energy-coupling factor transporter ATPase [Acutalibacteraceae bacterium]|nr:energy-coupling factor transporter ATPase [Acutalibacteraceae bacterium]